MTTPALTPAEHRVLAEKNLDTMRGYGPGSPGYHGLALSAIAHILAAVAEYLEPPPDQGIPGLPAGWRLETQRSRAGSRLWGFMLTAPDGEPASSRYSWSSPETAVAAGIRVARDVHAARYGQPDGSRSPATQEDSHE